MMSLKTAAKEAIMGYGSWFNVRFISFLRQQKISSNALVWNSHISTSFSYSSVELKR